MPLFTITHQLVVATPSMTDALEIANADADFMGGAPETLSCATRITRGGIEEAPVPIDPSHVEYLIEAYDEDARSLVKGHNWAEGNEKNEEATRQVNNLIELTNELRKLLTDRAD